jgi:hypothetical protein
LKIFRKHLGWYIERSGRSDPDTLRASKSRLCRLTDPAAVTAALTALWTAEDDRHNRVEETS